MQGEQLVSLDVAKLAKEKGFDWLCNHYYDERDGYSKNIKDNETTVISYRNYNDTITKVSLPTQSQLQSWFKEKYKIEIWAQPNIEFDEDDEFIPLPSMLDGSYEFYIYKDSYEGEHYLFFDTFSEAFDSGLKESFKYI